MAIDWSKYEIKEASPETDWDKYTIPEQNEIASQKIEPEQSIFEKAYRAYKKPRFELGAPGAVIHGIRKGVEDITHGLIQPISESGILGENIKQASKKVASERLKNYLQSQREHPIAAEIGNLAGDIGVGLPIYAPIGGITGAALSGGMMGGARYAYPKESRMRNMLEGSLLGGALGAAGKGFYKAGEITGKTINKLRNVKAGKFKPEYEEVMKASQKHGVPVFPGDVSTKGLLPKVSEISEKTPLFNILGARESQMGEAQRAASDLLKKQRERMIGTEFGGKNGLSKLKSIADGNSKRSSAARNLLQNIENSGDDWNRIIQTSGNVSLFNKKLRADELADRVSELASPFGSVPEIYTKKAVESALNELKELRIPDKKTLGILNRLNINLEKPQDYEGMKQFRSSLGHLIDDYKKGKNSLIGSEGIGYLQNIKNAVEKDMDIFAMSHSPELKKANQEFNNYYRKEVVPYKDAQLARALKNEDPDVVYSSFIKLNSSSEGKGYSRAQRFYNALDNKGREAVKTGLLQHAFEKAVKEETGYFSPALFTAELKRNMPAKSTFFNEKEKKDLEGFMKLMKHIERAGQTKGPETGVKNISYLMGLGSGLLGMVGVGTLGSSSYLLKKIMSSPGLAKFIAASSEAKPKINLKSSGKKTGKNISSEIIETENPNIGGE